MGTARTVSCRELERDNFISEVDLRCDSHLSDRLSVSVTVSVCLSVTVSVCPTTFLSVPVFQSWLWSAWSFWSQIASRSGQQRSGWQTLGLHTVQVTHTPSSSSSPLKNSAAAKLAGKADKHSAVEKAFRLLTVTVSVSLASRCPVSLHRPNVVCDTFLGVQCWQKYHPLTMCRQIICHLFSCCVQNFMLCSKIASLNWEDQSQTQQLLNIDKQSNMFSFYKCFKHQD